MHEGERYVIERAVERLQGDDGASPAVLAALKDPALRIYLQTWVITPLALIAKEDRSCYDLKLAKSLAT